jgi:hypothetical protein
MAFSRVRTSTPGGINIGSCANAVDPAMPAKSTTAIRKVIFERIRPDISAFLSIGLIGPVSGSVKIENGRV